MVHYVTKLKNEIEKLATEKNEVVEENSRNVVLIGELREEIRRLREEVGVKIWNWPPYPKNKNKICKLKPFSRRIFYLFRFFAETRIYRDITVTRLTFWHTMRANLPPKDDGA